MDSSTAAPNNANHRLFVGLPVDADAASKIRTWAGANYANAPVRLIDESQTHVTLLFFPSVTAETRQWMANLVRQIEWDTIRAHTGQTLLLGRSALGLELNLPDPVANRLDDRLIRSHNIGSFDYHEFLCQEPLGQLALAQTEAQWEPRRRNHRHGRRLALHTTFARINEKERTAIPVLPCPPIPIHLSRISLYESHLSPEGSRYEIIAEASQT